MKAALKAGGVNTELVLETAVPYKDSVTAANENDGADEVGATVSDEVVVTVLNIGVIVTLVDGVTVAAKRLLDVVVIAIVGLPNIVGAVVLAVVVMLLKIEEEDATATSSFPTVVSAAVVITGVKIDLTEVVTADVDVVLVEKICAVVTAFIASLETFENSNAGGCETEGLKVNTELGAEVPLAKLNALVLTTVSIDPDNLAVVLTGVTVTAAGVGVADIEIGDLKLKIAPPVFVLVTVVVLGELNLKSVAVEPVVAAGVLGDVTLLIDKSVPVIGAEKLKAGDGLTVFVLKDGASDFAVNEKDSCVVGTNAELTVVVKCVPSTTVADDVTLETKGLVDENVEGDNDVDEKLN